MYRCMPLAFLGLIKEQWKLTWSSGSGQMHTSLIQIPSRLVTDSGKLPKWSTHTVIAGYSQRSYLKPSQVPNADDSGEHDHAPERLIRVVSHLSSFLDLPRSLLLLSPCDVDMMQCQSSPDYHRRLVDNLVLQSQSTGNMRGTAQPAAHSALHILCLHCGIN